MSEMMTSALNGAARLVCRCAPARYRSLVMRPQMLAGILHSGRAVSMSSACTRADRTHTTDNMTEAREAASLLPLRPPVPRAAQTLNRLVNKSLLPTHLESGHRPQRLPAPRTP